MNQYTGEETNMLLDSIINYNDPETATLAGESSTFITIYGISNLIPCDLLIKLVHNDPILHFNTRLPRIFRDPYTFIHCIELDRVPLYIHSIPEVAAWRLRIGK
jgi:hypothetical protein